MALPAFMYRDPANVAEANQLRELGCTLCRHAVTTRMHGYCGHDRNSKQQGYPWKGYRCRLFESNEQNTKEQA